MGRKSLWTVSREGGEPARFHEFGSDQIHSGIGVSPDGRWANPCPPERRVRSPLDSLGGANSPS